MIDKNGCGVASTATGRFQVGHASGFLSLVTERPAAVLSSPCRARCTNSDALRVACWLAASATESASRTSVTVSAAASMKIYKISIEERRSGKFVGRRAAASRRGNAVHGVRRIGPTFVFTIDPLRSSHNSKKTVLIQVSTVFTSCIPSRPFG